MTKEGDESGVATSGDAESMKDMASQNPSILLGKTLRQNTCLHISSIHGHEGFCMDVLVLNRSLLSAVNLDEETPLLASVTRGHASLASVLLRRYSGEVGLREAILKQDKDGCNALHHAISSGHKDLALELIAAEPDLSQAVNIRDESPMFLAARRNFTDVFETLLNIPESAHTGPCGFNALHAAVRDGNQGIAKQIMETRPWLARVKGTNGHTPTWVAVVGNKIDVLRVLLEHDCSLGYEIGKSGMPLLGACADRGHVGVAQVLHSHCPDAPYHTAGGWTCLHQAVVAGST